MSQPNRPTHKERDKKLRDAVLALEEGRRFIIAEDKHFTQDIEDLQSASAKEHFERMLEFLKEIQASGGAECYTGAKPPYKSYAKGFTDVELFAFSWDSPSEGRKMYLKFGIRLSKKGDPTYLYLNCHEDAPEKKNR